MKKLTTWDVTCAVAITIACAIYCAVMNGMLVKFVDEPTKRLGSMWAVVATVFVFRKTRARSLDAGLHRLFATCVSFALCLAYLLIFPPTELGTVIGLGTLAMMLLVREDDIVTTRITSAVVMVVAAINPQEAWQQSILRLIDTVVGVAVGVAWRRIGSFAFYRAVGQPVQ